MTVEVTIRRENNWEWMEGHIDHKVTWDNEGDYFDLYCRDCGESIAQFVYKPNGSSTQAKAKAPEPSDEPCERCGHPERIENSTYCASCITQRELNV